MDQSWKLSVWGVRGSMPAPSRDFLEFGGNTACVCVDCRDDLVVFDAGSGLSAPGRPTDGHRPIHIFISHVHIDHLLGLFTFPPLHNPEAEIHLYGQARAGVSFRRQLETLVGPPYWPVGFSDFRARVAVHETGPDREIALSGGRVVRAMEGNHPNGSLLYRLQSPGRSVVHALDCELTEPLRPGLTEFCRDAGVLIWDANFTASDLLAGWGHSTWEQGAALGREANAALVLMTHFSNGYTDEFLRGQERLAGAANAAVRFAREGTEIVL